jgi:hypothetical protein
LPGVVAGGLGGGDVEQAFPIFEDGLRRRSRGEAGKIKRRGGAEGKVRKQQQQ